MKRRDLLRSFCLAPLAWLFPRKLVEASTLSIYETNTMDHAIGRIQSGALLVGKDVVYTAMGSGVGRNKVPRLEITVTEKWVVSEEGFSLFIGQVMK